MSVYTTEILIFMRYPTAGKAKTRLIPKIGAERAALLHRRMTENIVRVARSRGGDGSVTACFTGEPKHKFRAWLGTDLNYRKQPNGDLGDRLRNAFAAAFRAGSKRVVVVGSDVPNVTPEILSQAESALENRDVVLGPAADGGYYLLGMNRMYPDLFCGMNWGGENVCDQTRDAIVILGLKSTELPMLNDVDRPEDLASLRDDPRFVDVFSEQPLLSVIIPTLNEDNFIAATLDQVGKSACIETSQKVVTNCQCATRRVAQTKSVPISERYNTAKRACSQYFFEVIVVDGGSSDSTCDIAVKSGATVLNVGGGRAAQLNAGAKHAHGRHLLFLHADTLLTAGYQLAINKALSEPSVVAGAFRFRTDVVGIAMRLVEWGTNIRSALFRLPYGDQGIFLEKRVFDELGGFPPAPIMEDFDLVCRLRRRGKIVTLHNAVTTSARRWQRLGLLRTMFRNQIMIAGFMMGVSPDRLAKFYRGKTITI